MNVRKAAMKRAKQHPTGIGIAHSGRTVVVANVHVNRGISVELPSSAAAKMVTERFRFWCTHADNVLEAFKVAILEASWCNNRRDRIERLTRTFAAADQGADLVAILRKIIAEPEPAPAEEQSQ